MTIDGARRAVPRLEICLDSLMNLSHVREWPLCVSRGAEEDAEGQEVAGQVRDRLLAAGRGERTINRWDARWLRTHQHPTTASPIDPPAPRHATALSLCLAG